MEANYYCIDDMFKNSLINILSKLGISDENIETFTTTDMPIGDLGICMDITNIIDDQMREIYPDTYLGIVPKDTFKTILKYHDLI